MSKIKPSILIFVLIFFVTVTVGCGSRPVSETGSNNQIQILTTTTLVGDVVAQVGGDKVNQRILIPPGVDEHGFQPSPQDIARAAQVDLVFINGAGLETFIEKMVQSAGENVPLVSISEGIALKEGQEEHADEGEEDEGIHDEGDPHVWTDPNNVIIWVDNIEKALSEADPANAAYYQENAKQYRQQLRDLDAWIVDQVSQIPPERRKLVTDHTVFTYFASRYGFDQIGAVIPGYSTLSQPSAQEMAALEDTIRDLQVPAIFVGNTVNPGLAERVAEDTKTQLIYILTGSLSDESGPGANYLDYMRYNVQAIVEALK